jgi:hypothetical protein
VAMAADAGMTEDDLQLARTEGLEPHPPPLEFSSAKEIKGWIKASRSRSYGAERGGWVMWSACPVRGGHGCELRSVRSHVAASPPRNTRARRRDHSRAVSGPVFAVCLCLGYGAERFDFLGGVKLR